MNNKKTKIIILGAILLLMLIILLVLKTGVDKNEEVKKVLQKEKETQEALERIHSNRDDYTENGEWRVPLEEVFEVVDHLANRLALQDAKRALALSPFKDFKVDPLFLLAMSIVEHPGYTKHDILWSSAYPFDKIENFNDLSPGLVTEASGDFSDPADKFGSIGPLQFTPGTFNRCMDWYNSKKLESEPAVINDRINWFSNCVAGVTYAYLGYSKRADIDWKKELGDNQRYKVVALISTHHNTGKGWGVGMIDYGFRKFINDVTSPEGMKKIRAYAKYLTQKGNDFYVTTGFVQKMFPKEFSKNYVGSGDYHNITLPHIVKTLIAYECLIIRYGG